MSDQTEVSNSLLLNSSSGHESDLSPQKKKSKSVKSGPTVGEPSSIDMPCIDESPSIQENQVDEEDKSSVDVSLQSSDEPPSIQVSHKVDDVDQSSVLVVDIGLQSTSTSTSTSDAPSSTQNIQVSSIGTVMNHSSNLREQPRTQESRLAFVRRLTKKP